MWRKLHRPGADEKKMFKFQVFCTIFLGLTASGCGSYRIGLGIADVTGPVGVTLMGYGQLGQRGSGIHLRQWSRAYVISDGSDRLVFVSVDLGMMGDGVRIQVIRALERKYNGLYNMDNVILSATHTHSAPGGFLMHTLFDLPSLGFCNETFNTLVSGIVQSVSRAHSNMREGKIYLSRGVLENASINRSPSSYEANPPEEKARFRHNVDKDILQLKFLSASGEPLGVINWFAIHATSMNNTNTLISSDNVGYASVLFEQKMNPGKLIGKGPFIASFASSNLGDVSPNIKGPKCHQSSEECDAHSKCRSPFEECYADGPGEDVFESTKIIGRTLFEKAWELWSGSSTLIEGPIRSIHQYVDMPKAEAEVLNKTTGEMEKVHGCNPAMGYASGAGTTDGPFLFFLKQGTTESIWWLDALTQLVVKPTEEDKRCHAPKPILLITGQMKIPFDWQPSIVSTQVAFLGNLTLACVPGEFTTMSGRRMREAIARARGLDPKTVIIVGLCNTYSDYITTYEEYQVQRYEAASTIYGPHTLSLYLSQYKKLTEALMKNVPVGRGPEPQNLDSSKMLSLIPSVKFDNADPGTKFGDVVQQPPDVVTVGETVRAVFVSGNPRNHLRHEDSYLTVEHFVDNEWVVTATDANWETRIRWKPIFLMRKTEVEVEWQIPETTSPGLYRIRHLGHNKVMKGDIYPYEGITNVFKVQRKNEIPSIFARR